MKLLSIVVPCYNSEEYMEKCIDTLLSSNINSLEIIIINDGSKDKTSEIADRYVKYHPDKIKAIHQENGGHGEAINSGLRNATGRYFKVVDSDDWVETEAYNKVLEALSLYDRDDCELDMLLSNFVYEKEGAVNKKVMHYRKMLPMNKVFNWDDAKSFKLGQYILMHSVIYNTKLLKEIELTLPKHTFYVDNIFVFLPLLHVNRILYIDVDLYRYFIGRNDQSVNEQIMIRRVDQQIRVTNIMMKHYMESISNCTSSNLKRYMYHYLEIMTAISSILLINSGKKEDLKKKKEFWDIIKEFDELLYFKLRTGFFGMVVNLPGKLGRKITVRIYRLSQKVVGFN